jgi:hypothetical protein
VIALLSQTTASIYILVVRSDVVPSLMNAGCSTTGWIVRMHEPFITALMASSDTETTSNSTLTGCCRVALLLATFSRFRSILNAITP